MAKDKGKKSKGGGEFARPSEAPAGGDGWKFEHEDNIGSLFLITPLREQDHTTPEYGDKTVIVADIVELNESKPAKSELHEDAWIFGGWTKGSVRGFIGEKRVLGRLTQGKKDRGNKPWMLEDADDDDIAVATAYIESVDPFTTKGAKGSKGKKGKGGK